MHTLPSKFRSADKDRGWNLPPPRIASVLEAELWAALDGLAIDWKRGHDKVIFESDDNQILKQLLNNYRDEDYSNSLIHNFKTLLQRN
ncbi:hypothetical protein PVK06_022303 [Gossypium arboreum]|uniref:RNase H type-1 domain-containing protein n=1 Tax=Gossypium arboreum TaxID=29729 RepID=A0ABR0P873_GOSAR|nr:hypothetical protein PVK06_022303 [Gossypium arboreum]